MKAVDLLLGVRDQADFDQPHQPQADRLRRQPCVVAADQLRLLQADAPPRTLGGGEPHQLAQLLIGQTAVGL